MGSRSISRSDAFSMVEVVLALGIVAFGIVAILGVIPAGLRSGRSSQEDTRSNQLAQDVFASLVGQAQKKYPFLSILQPATATSPAFRSNVDLSSAKTYDTLAANNDGRLIALTKASDAIGYQYQIVIQVNPAPTNFDKGFASEVLLRVISPPSSDLSKPFNSNQTVRDYVRIISKY